MSYHKGRATSQFKVTLALLGILPFATAASQAQPPKLLDESVVSALHRMRTEQPDLFKKIELPAPEMKSVAGLIGDWTQDDEILATPEGKARSATSRLAIKEAFGGAWLQMSDPDDPGVVDYLGADPATGDWVYLHLDRPGLMGTLRSHGGWVEDSLTLGGEITEYGLIVPERVVVSKQSPDRWEMRWEQRIAGNWQLISTSKFTRR